MRRSYARTSLGLGLVSQFFRSGSTHLAPPPRIRRLAGESLEGRNMLSGASLEAYLATTTLAAPVETDALAAEAEASTPAAIAAGEAACAAGEQQAPASDVDAVFSGWIGPVAVAEGEGEEDPFDPDPFGGDPFDPDPWEGGDPTPGLGDPPVITGATWVLEGNVYFIEGSVTDDEDLTGCGIRFENGLEGGTSIDSNWDFYFSVEDWPDGPPSAIDIIATDSDGNDSAVFTLQFIV